MILKELYLQQLINEHYVPMVTLTQNIELAKKIAKQEEYLKSIGYTDKQLDLMYNEAKENVKTMLKKLD